MHSRQALYPWLTPSNALSYDFWDCILASCPGRPWAWDLVWSSHLSSPPPWTCMWHKVQTYFCIKIHGDENHYIFLNLTLINCPPSFFSGIYWWRGWRKRNTDTVSFTQGGLCCACPSGCSGLWKCILTKKSSCYLFIDYFLWVKCIWVTWFTLASGFQLGLETLGLPTLFQTLYFSLASIFVAQALQVAGITDMTHQVWLSFWFMWSFPAAHSSFPATRLQGRHTESCCQWFCTEGWFHSFYFIRRTERHLKRHLYHFLKIVFSCCHHFFQELVLWLTCAVVV